MVTDENASKGNESEYPFRECRKMFEAMSKCCRGGEGFAKCCSDMGAMMEIVRDKIKRQGDQKKTKKEE